jgi:hypothetical protein
MSKLYPADDVDDNDDDHVNAKRAKIDRTFVWFQWNLVNGSLFV